MANILVVDDEIGIRELLSEILGDEGHSITLAENAAQARAARLAGAHDLVLLDIWMPDTDGVSLLKEWSAGGLLTMPVLMMSGHATIDTAVEATRIGAVDFLEKPIALAKLLAAVKRALVVKSLPRHAPAAPPPPPVPEVAEAPAPAATGFDLDAPLREARDAFERAYFAHHLAREKGSMTRIAEKTGLERTHLYRKLKALGLPVGSRKTEDSGDAG
ncbi:MAG: response regulator [Burkholderiales bacterium]|nr:response regulator [Burkholderiales bacterium]